MEAISAGELIVEEGKFEGGLENVVLEDQMPVSKAPAARDDLSVTLEEEALHLIAGLGDLEPKRNLQLIGHDLCVP
jgi:hypothetical protein